MHNTIQVRQPSIDLLDTTKLKLQQLKELEESPLILRSASLSSVTNSTGIRNRSWQREISSLDEESFHLRAQEMKSLVDKFPDSLLQGLQDSAMKSKELKHRVFKQTLDFGLVFRERALGNVSYFLHTLGLSEQEVIKIFSDEPSNACRDCEKSVAPKIRWLRKLGFNWKTIVVGYVSRGTFRCSLKKLQINFNWMKELGATESMCVDMMRHQPALLRRDLVALDEKLLFAVIFLNRDILDIIRWPAYLTYSLERRIMLRTAFCLAKKVDFDSFPFVSAIGSQDEYFCNLKMFKVNEENAASLEEYLKFRDWWLSLYLDGKFKWIIDIKDKLESERSRMRSTVGT